MKNIFLVLSTVIISAFGEDINFDELRKSGTNVEKSVIVPGIASQGQSYMSRFSEIDDRRAEESKRYASSHSSQQSESSSSSQSTQGSSSSSSSSSNSKGVKRIENNGKDYADAQSWAVTCNNNSRRILAIHRDGHWHLNGSVYDMGPKFDSWSKEQVGDYACKEL